MIGNEVIISDSNYTQFISPIVDGERKSHGLKPRDFTTHPVGYSACAPPFDMQLIPQSEWAERLADLVAKKALLSDIRNTGFNGGRIPSRDQNGKGYCWAHSTVSCMLIIRAIMNLPFSDLSAYAIACIIKRYMDEGGWGLESCEWAAENGCPSSKTWAQQSMSRSNDTPAMREEAKGNRIQEWMDCPERSMAHLGTILLSGIPGIGDFNFWSHSVGLLDLVNGATLRQQCRNAAGKLFSLKDYDDLWGMNTIMQGFGVRLWNSWGDGWSENGTGILTGDKAIPDGLVAPRVITATAA